MSSGARGWVGQKQSAMERVEHNDASMANDMDSSKSLRHFDACCGIHGHMRARRGAKRGTSAARRRHEKRIIKTALEEADI